MRGKQKANISRHRGAYACIRCQPPKCDANARANEPKPPRVTPDSDVVPGDEEPGEESPPKKLLRRDQYPP
jgi:hypothetical protein